MFDLLKRLAIWLIRLPAVITCWCLDVGLSRRGIIIGVLLSAAIFVAGGWLRPPLSPDLRAVHLTLNFDGIEAIEPDQLLMTPRPFRYDSVGLVLLVLIGVALLVALIRPKFLPLVLGVVVVGAFAGNAIVLFNHPRVLDLLDSEMLQRLQVGTVLRPESEQTLAGNSPSRLEGLLLPKTDNQPVYDDPKPGSFTRGRTYLAYGPWLLSFAVFLVLLETPGTWPRRLAVTGCWVGVGLVAGALCCSNRLHAEYVWNNAELLEQSGDLKNARSEIARSVAIFPDFAELQRTWLLTGKIDYRLGTNTPEQQFYQITQLAYHSDRGQALGLMTELFSKFQSPDDEQNHLSLPLRELGALVYCDAARKSLSLGLVSAADDYYLRACKIAPHRFDSIVGLADTLARSDRDHPEVIDAKLSPLDSRLGDRTLRADLAERVADAYFEAGRLQDARRFYQLSLDIFCEPKYVNAPAQEGMLGM